MKHTLNLVELNDKEATFQAFHQVAERPANRSIGTEPYGPFSVVVITGMFREDWEAAGRPTELEVGL